MEFCIGITNGSGTKYSTAEEFLKGLELLIRDHENNGRTHFSITVEDEPIDRNSDPIMHKIKKSNVTKYYDFRGNYITLSTDIHPAETFMSEDFRGAYPGVRCIEIFDIYVRPEDRHRGIGSALIKRAISEDPNAIYLVGVGASMKEYPNCPSDEEIYDIIEQLKPFYEKNGFRDVNEKFGNYETKNSYMYISNLLGHLIYKDILNNLDENDNISYFPEDDKKIKFERSVDMDKTEETWFNRSGDIIATRKLCDVIRGVNGEPISFLEIMELQE